MAPHGSARARALSGAGRLAAFAAGARYEDVSAAARDQLKIRILDALGCAIGAVDSGPPRDIRALAAEFGGGGKCALLGGGKAHPDYAALYHGALVRYLDFNDSYLARGETCHPSDNLGAVLAAGDYSGAKGRDLMTALAVAYQVQCRLSDVAPARAAGFDHTVQGSYAVAAAVSRMFRLGAVRAAHAIAMSGAALNALRVTRTGRLSNWKGLAYPFMASSALRLALLARQGITGPLEVMEGDKGLMDAITGPFEIDWSKESLDRVTRTILKKHNAEIHSQTAIEAALELRRAAGFRADEVEVIDVHIFDVAYNIIGGGEEGDKTSGIETKEQADHSLPYLIAVALLDGQVSPRQYGPARISRSDVQGLLRLVTVRPSPSYSRRFPSEMPCRMLIRLRGGRELSCQKSRYPGFYSQPMSWEEASAKFKELAEPHMTCELGRKLIDAVYRLERESVAGLMALLAQVRIPPSRRGGKHD